MQAGGRGRSLVRGRCAGAAVLALLLPVALCAGSAEAGQLIVPHASKSQTVVTHAAPTPASTAPPTATMAETPQERVPHPPPEPAPPPQQQDNPLPAPTTWPRPDEYLGPPEVLMYGPCPMSCLQFLHDQALARYLKVMDDPNAINRDQAAWALTQIDDQIIAAGGVPGATTPGEEDPMRSYPNPAVHPPGHDPEGPYSDPDPPVDGPSTPTGQEPFPPEGPVNEPDDGSPWSADVSKPAPPLAAPAANDILLNSTAQPTYVWGRVGARAAECEKRTTPEGKPFYCPS